MVFSFGLKKAGIGAWGNKVLNGVKSFGHKVSHDLTGAGNWVQHETGVINNALEKGKNIIDKVDSAVQGTPLSALTGIAKGAVNVLQGGTRVAGSVSQGLLSAGSLGTDLLSGNFKNIKNEANSIYHSGKDAISGGKEVLAGGTGLVSSITPLVV